METDYRQIILLLVAVGLPIFLLITKRERLLLGWVAITLFVQIFDTSIVTNLPAGRIVGLIYLPTAFSQIHEWLRLKPVKAWAINLIYLLILATCFGWLWPWHDITMARPFTLAAHGRSIVYPIRMISDLSLAIFIMNQLRAPGMLYYLGRAVVIGATLTALGGVYYLLTRTDLYFPLTGIAEQGAMIDRARGLSIEPRVLGLSCAYGVMVLLLGRGKIFKIWPVLILINLVVLLITYSASSYVLLVAGALTTTLFFSNKERALAAGMLLLATCITISAVVYFPERIDYALDTLQMRLDPDYKLSGIPPGTVGEEIAYRLDVFDACALLFLLDQPYYALIGTGPGMVSLPASYYVPPGVYSLIWTPDVGINSLPFHGLLLEVSNSGLPGLMLWLIQIFSCWRALRLLSSRIVSGDERPEWRFGYAIFIIGVVFYVVQVSSSPVWSIFLAIGWSAYRIVEERIHWFRLASVEEGLDQIFWRPDLARPK